VVLGYEILDWLQTNNKISRDNALNFYQKLMDGGYIRPANFHSKLFKETLYPINPPHHYTDAPPLNSCTDDVLVLKGLKGLKKLDFII